MPIIVRAGDDFLRSLSETQVGIGERADDAALRKQRHSPQLSLVLRGQLNVEWTRTGKAFPSSQSSVYIANNRKLLFNRSFLWSRHLELRECACQSHGKWLRKRRRGATGAAHQDSGGCRRRFGRWLRWQDSVQEQDWRSSCLPGLFVNYKEARGRRAHVNRPRESGASPGAALSLWDSDSAFSSRASGYECNCKPAVLTA